MPLAQVYRYDGGERWTLTGRLDETPDAKYRRVWTMAVYRGRLYCGTLPSGRVHALEAGRCASMDTELAPGWHHLAGVRERDRLKPYVDGKLAAESSSFEPADYDLSNGVPLSIGVGPQDHFRGLIRDLRLVRGALGPAEVAGLFSER